MADPRVIQHGTRKRYSKGCRCDECRAAETDYTRQYRKKRKAAKTIPHGTFTGYACGCRCNKCKGFMSKYRHSVLPKVETGDPSVKHGDRRTYARGCRCEACRVEERQYRNKINGSRDFDSPDYPHGEPRGYKNGCRCDVCSEAKSEYGKALIDAKDKTAPDYPHGTRLGARNGCDCEDCLEAKRKHEKSYLRRLRKENPDFVEKQRLSGRIHAAKRRQRIVETVTEDELIREIYRICPNGYHVDHKVPLSVGGRHEPDNLQYLPEKINQIKGNRLDYDCSDHAIAWQDLLKETSTTIPKGSRPQAGSKSQAA